MSEKATHLTKSEKLAHLSRQKESSKSISIYCKEQGLNANTFRNWQKRYRQDVPSTSFKKVGSFSLDEIFSGSDYELELKGVKVKIPKEFTKESLTSILEVISSL